MRKVNMMVQRLVILLLVMVALVGSVRAEDAKEVVIASAEELKGIKAKKITWKKDGAKMVLIPPAVLIWDRVRVVMSSRCIRFM